ncbi:MAG: T9SS type A sorting domain-containing protein [Ignavibacteriae bacterium]|nr:T9SS type A sorting domain-containing protein [Ignavibacteriota bacterium]
MKHRLLLILLIILSLNKNTNGQSWDKAFNELHNQMKQNYALGEWKNINWDELYNTYSQKILSAKNTNNVEDYYLALRQYQYSFNDLHVGMGTSNNDARTIINNVRDKFIKGSFGFTVIELDDGRVIANYVSPYSEAANAKLEYGCEIVEINNVSAKNYLTNISSLWSDTPQATQEGIKHIQERFIGRDSVGSIMNLKFKLKGNNDITSIDLEAVFDGEMTINKTNYYTRGITTTVFGDILDDNIGYIKVLNEGLSAAWEADSIIAQFDREMTKFSKRNLSGIILDLRYNEGGWDRVGAAICGYFYKEQTLYEKASFYSEAQNGFKITNSLNITPRDPYFSKLVVVLTSLNTVSTGEGPPYFIKKLPNGETLGFYGTRGSFAINSTTANMPEGFIFWYPPGRSIDINNVIQVDSNGELIGGVTPSIRIPKTEENVKRQFIDKEDLELEYAKSHILSVTNVDDNISSNQVTNNFHLEQNYPNPFNPSTIISYTISSQKFVNLSVYNILGEKVATLINEIKSKGSYEIQFSGVNFSSGVYYYVLDYGKSRISKKMLLVK